MGKPPIKKLCACIKIIFCMDNAIAGLSFSSIAFSSPHKDANDPLSLASPVFSFTENNTPFAGEPGYLPE